MWNCFQTQFEGVLLSIFCARLEPRPLSRLGSGALWPKSAVRWRNACTSTPTPAGLMVGNALPRGWFHSTRVRALALSGSTALSTRTSQCSPPGSLTRSLPTMRIASPGCSCVARPSSQSSVSPDWGRQGTRVCTGMAFHCTRAGTSATVSKLCAVSSWPGTLCTRVPTGIWIGSGGAAPRAPRPLEPRGGGGGGAARGGGGEPVADQARHLTHREALGGGAQVVFLRVAFGVEAQHVERGGHGVGQRQAEVAHLACAQGGQRRCVGARQPGLHRGQEVAVAAHPPGNGRHAGRVVHARRGVGVHAGAAAAVAVAGRGVLATHYLPPCSSSRSTPCSGKFGSLSSRTISSRPSVMKPSARGLGSAWPWRWKRVTWTEPTPATVRAAAYSGLRNTVWPKLKWSGWNRPRVPSARVRLLSTSSRPRLTSLRKWSLSTQTSRSISSDTGIGSWMRRSWPAMR